MGFPALSKRHLSSPELLQIYLYMSAWWKLLESLHGGCQHVSVKTRGFVRQEAAAQSQLGLEIHTASSTTLALPSPRALK